MALSDQIGTVSCSTLAAPSLVLLCDKGIKPQAEDLAYSSLQHTCTTFGSYLSASMGRREEGIICAISRIDVGTEMPQEEASLA